MIKKDQSKREIAEEYIKNHYDCTKTEYINYMRGHDRHGYPVKEKSPKHLSQKPAEKLLKDLTSGRKPIIISFPDENNSQIHHLRVNDKNLYNQIDQTLSDIETKILRWNEPIDKINKLAIKDEEKARRIKQNYVYAYYNTIGMMLRHFPNRIRSIKFSKKEAQVLNEKVMQLNKEFSDQILGIEGFEEAVKLVRDHISATRDNLIIPNFKNEAHDYVKVEMLNDLMKTLELFYKQFSIQVNHSSWE